MAFKLRMFLGVIVVIITVCSQEVFGQTSTATPLSSAAVSSSSTAVASATSGASGASGASVQITATTTMTVSPSSSVAPSEKFETQVMASVEVEKCNIESHNILKAAIEKLFKNVTGYDFTKVDIAMADNSAKCVANITMKFGKHLSQKNIIAKFENATKFEAIEGKLLSIQGKVDGVTLHEFKANEKECESKCCGTGGEIAVKAECTPTDKCVNYKLTKMVSDCSTVCTCAGAMFKVSLMVLVVSGLINWFLKE